jgi:uncharacterized protein YcnI
MRYPPRAPKRALLTVAATGFVMSIGLATGAASAAAHVHVDDPAPGATSVLTFQVPGESETGTLTTQLSVQLPNVASARTEVMPGWTASLERDKAAGTQTYSADNSARWLAGGAIILAAVGIGAALTTRRST